jgi:transcriptional regulator with XRE-family HTH domain
MKKDANNLFSALLRHWRNQRGMSQLDLAIAAGVSSRHVSFLETGRAQPSREMVLLLGSTLDVPLRDQNILLDAAGFPAAWEEPSLESGGMPKAIGEVLERMLAHHEPFPMAVMTRTYDLSRANRAAMRVIAAMTLEPQHLGEKPNLMRVLFDPRLARPFVVDWERVARQIVSRLHRESLARPHQALTSLVRALLELPGVPESFRHPDFSAPSEPTFTLRLKRDDLSLSFLATVTTFSAPQNVTLEELMIESYFPLDDETTAHCERLARGS